MRKYRRGLKMAAAITAIAALTAGRAAMAFDLGDALKILGGGAIIGGVLAEPANELINTVTFNRGIATTQTTKVVPILSAGQGAKIGMAQVAGPGEAVNTCKAVLQIETTIGSSVRANILVPIDSTNPFQGIRRVQEVGVSAIIDYRL